MTNALRLLAMVIAQLEPTSGMPISGSDSSSGGQTELVRLPRSFGMSQRVVARSGTAIYKLGEWKAVCPVRHAKPKVEYIDGVVFEERRDLNYVVRAVSAEHDFPMTCKLAPVRGRFTLIFAEPGGHHSPALAARAPDYIVP